MDFYAIAWLAGFAFLGLCVLRLAFAIEHHTDTVRHDREDK